MHHEIPQLAEHRHHPRTIAHAMAERTPDHETGPRPRDRRTESGRTPPDPQWRAIAERDEGWRDVFVYAVRTTGVFCRPGCPSRRPRRGNVALFTDPEAARAAGYRACRRCRPESAAPGDEDRRRVVAACRYLERPWESVPSMTELAAHVGTAVGTLRALFRRQLGISPKEYADAARVDRFRVALHRDGLDVTSALYEAGFGASSRLYEQADRVLGMTPGRYRRRAAGEVVHYRIVRTRLGLLLVAGTGGGLCRVALDDRSEALRATLEDELGAAELIDGGNEVDRWAEALRAYVDGEDGWPELPVDIAATAFQARVYRALRRLPSGVRATYAQIAQAIGAPRAARAVGRACATNPVALAIPCHRVVPAGGGLGGYRWGLDRKAALLDGERAEADSTGP